ncbi:Uncharacterised protein [Mycobacterium tuberculosis]|uniref:Uncharacterized protein n=1 Tax=Mycobacterium tuberculosis TaxID=1773 RepID=A0A654ZN66_MYCTX|nr:Uncharacterised protein [Mycobacterium tuberculosis]CKQ42392.1 Uncharacterised protein [Mycobacterium tuberculosis]CKS86950.1 Uncharacterised protein [Mycobacterium tuberculosis]CKT41213.1 Uncharacterised protein [Mycobacterium tuberculosis]CKT48126.1 Uncharacterised protein [Mycobacterium tuberculosis]
MPTGTVAGTWFEFSSTVPAKPRRRQASITACAASATWVSSGASTSRGASCAPAAAPMIASERSK